MTRAEDDLITSLENRVRALTETCTAQYDLIEQQTTFLEVRAQQVAYLEAVVELLSLPRTTEDDLRMVADGLVELLQQKELIH